MKLSLVLNMHIFILLYFDRHKHFIYSQNGINCVESGRKNLVKSSNQHSGT